MGKFNLWLELSKNILLAIRLFLFQIYIILLWINYQVQEAQIQAYYSKFYP